MTPEQIIAAKQLTLKPNAYFRDPSLPFNFQKKGILMMVVRPRMILGDDVGLGKTVESLIAFSYMKAHNPKMRALVLTEKLSLKQWVEEMKKFTPGLTARIITSATHPDPTARIRAFRQHKADLLITGYGQLYDYGRYMIEGLGEKWVLLADEPNYFKNRDTVLYKNMRGLIVGDQDGYPYWVATDKDKDGKRIDRMIRTVGSLPARAYGMTATIIENRLEEAYGVFSVIAPTCFSSELQFINDYCIRKKIKGRFWKTTGYKNLQAFRKQIAPYYYGRLDTDPEVDQELPEVIPKDLPITLSKEQSFKLLEAMDRFIEMPDGKTKHLPMLASLTMAQILADDPNAAGFKMESEKTSALIEALTGSLAGQRVLVFSRFRRIIDLIEGHLRKERLDVVRITGKESEEKRTQARHRFMSDGPDRCNIILGTRAIVKSANLQKGAHIFMYDIPWSYGWYRQLVGRLKRTGSTQKHIGVYRMLACLHPDVADRAGSERTIDHYVLKTVMKKQLLWKALTDDTEEMDSSPSDVQAIWETVREGMST